ncbi:Hypothetical predicted protein [Podarcis lilfordi]|nr:Hypothetical predicted protein [Podarcis lilfordi]
MPTYSPPPAPGSARHPRPYTTGTSSSAKQSRKYTLSAGMAVAMLSRGQMSRGDKSKHSKESSGTEADVTELLKAILRDA